MERKQITLSKAQSMGGKARAAILTPERRSEIAQMGGLARRNQELAESRQAIAKRKKVE